MSQLHRGLLQLLRQSRSTCQLSPPAALNYAVPRNLNTNLKCTEPALSYNSTALIRNFRTSCFVKGAFEDKDTKALTVWSSIKQVPASPIPALTLGLSGLVPFVSAPAYMMMQQLYCSDLAFAQVAYGATILAFLGGVRWGFTLPEENPVRPDWVNLGYSVTPSLVAWGGLLLPHPMSLFTLMGGLTFAGYMDIAMYGYPPWFKGMRFILSFVAVLSLWTTFMCGFLLQPQSKNKDEQ